MKGKAWYIWTVNQMKVFALRVISHDTSPGTFATFLFKCMVWNFRFPRGCLIKTMTKDVIWQRHSQPSWEHIDVLTLLQGSSLRCCAMGPLASVVSCAYPSLKCPEVFSAHTRCVLCWHARSSLLVKCCTETMWLVSGHDQWNLDRLIWIGVRFEWCMTLHFIFLGAFSQWIFFFFLNKILHPTSFPKVVLLLWDWIK